MDYIETTLHLPGIGKFKVRIAETDIDRVVEIHAHTPTQYLQEVYFDTTRRTHERRFYGGYKSLTLMVSSVLGNCKSMNRWRKLWKNRRVRFAIRNLKYAKEI